jgi:hypothetical protein
LVEASLRVSDPVTPGRVKLLPAEFEQPQQLWPLTAAP